MPSLIEQPVHLGRGGSAVIEPVFDGPDWYAGYDDRHGADGGEGRLVTRWQFDASWDSWEMHPVGAEMVLCIAGSLTLIQSHPDGRTERLELGAGDYAINPPGIWHTADLADGDTADCLFITTGAGTEHRAR